MVVLDSQILMLPVLRPFANGQERGLRDAADPIAQEYLLSHDDAMAALPSGRQTRFRNRTAWALAARPIDSIQAGEAALI